MSSTDALSAIDDLLVARKDAIEDFLSYHRNQVRCPVYASVDIRRNAFKAAVVDANAFPAGFNNLAARSHAAASEAIRSYMARSYPGADEILILAEGHTRNRGYFQNLKTLRDLFEAAGFQVVLGTLNEELFPQADVETIDGDVITIHGVLREGDDLIAGGVVADVVILNNDLAEGSPAILDALRQPVTPPPSMGWHRRRKVEHFRIVNELTRQLGAHAGFDPWLVSAEFETVEDVDFRGREGLDRVAAAIDVVIARVAAKYETYGIGRTPRVFVKADPGTYGMGITTATSGEEFLALNSKGRERMDRGKGRIKTSRVLVQESVPTDLRSAGPAPGVAEPVMYMVCGKVVGGFNRVHDKKSEDENLNSPGGRFEPLAFSTQGGDPGPDEAPLDDTSMHIYQVLGEIASIATGYELRLANDVGAPLPPYP